MIYTVDNTHIEEMVNERAYKRYRSYLIRNIALFENNGGSFCRGNPRAIYDELEREQTNLKLIWIVNSENVEIPEGVKTVKKYSKRYWRLLATAKFLITDTQQNRMYRKRKQQRYIQLSHGTPIKHVGVDVTYQSEFEKREVIVDALEDCRRWSYLAVSSDIAHQHYQDSYTHRQTVLRTGLPESDVIFKRDNYREVLDIKRKLGIKYGERVVITNFHNKNNSVKMRQKLSADHSKFKYMEYSDIRNLVTFKEASLVSEMLITDNYDLVITYSLVMKPIIFYQFDEETEYYDDLSKYFPGGKIEVYEELSLMVRNMKKYQNMYYPHMEKFNLKYNQYEQGNSAAKIIKAAKIGTKPTEELTLLRKVEKKNAKYIERMIDKAYLKALTFIDETTNGFVDKLIKKTQLLIPASNDLIFFESFLGRNYSDNPKAIYEELLHTNSNLKCIWSLDNPESAIDIPGEFKVVRRLTPLYFYYLARSKYIVSNSRLTRKFEKKESQVYIQTWHGTPLKKLVLDMENVTLPGTNKQNYYINFLKEAHRWDYLISANKYSTEKFKSAFSQEEILEIGYPRNDILVNHTQHDIDLCRERIGLYPEDKVILYAPTFRDNSSETPGEYNQQMKLDLEALAIKCPDWKILLRTHYLVTEEIEINTKNVIDVSKYDDVNDLYLASDVLMTDYSSVFFDYAILNRPIIFFAYDLKEYERDMRGFYLDYHTLPGQNIEDTQDLIEILDDIEEYRNRYQYELDKFRNEYTSLEKGNASKYVVDLIMDDRLRER